jgi:hypothetical protein
MGYKGTEHSSIELIQASSGKRRRGVNRRVVDDPTTDLYEIRPHKGGCGVDLISDRLRRGPIWYSGPDAVRNAVAYAKYRSLSRSHRAIIRVLDDSNSAIQAL